MSAKPKSIRQTYVDAYDRIAKEQKAKHGNPYGDPSTDRAVPAIEGLVTAGHITEAQARKLAAALGRLDYGEWSLTCGRVNQAFRKIITNHADIPWQVIAQFENDAGNR